MLEADFILSAMNTTVDKFLQSGVSHCFGEKPKEIDTAVVTVISMLLSLKNEIIVEVILK